MEDATESAVEFHELPDELQSLIWNQLSTKELTETCMLVCKEWKNRIQSLLPSLLCFNEDINKECALPVYLSRFDEHKPAHLRFQHPVLSPTSIFDRFHQLVQVVVVHSNSLDNAGVKLLADRCSGSLVDLELRYCCHPQLDDHGLSHLNTCTALRCLIVSSCTGISGDFFEQVTSSLGNNLRRLEFTLQTRQPQVNYPLQSIASYCTNLTHLDFSWTRTVWEADFCSIALSCTQLGTLKMRQTWITDEVLEVPFRRLNTCLTCLDVGCTALYDVSLKHVANCPNLVSLQVDQLTELSDATLLHIATTCTKLQHLNVAGVKLDPSTLQTIRSLCPHLKQLVLL